MAGIYISNMEMPQNCWTCPIRHMVFHVGDECYLGAKITVGHQRPEDCPLVPVPEFSDIGSDSDDVWKKIFSLVVLLLSDREKFDKIRDDVLADLEAME